VEEVADDEVGDTPVRILRWLIVPAFVAAAAAADPPKADDLKSQLPPVLPKTPADAAKTFKVLDGFRMDLIACEPQVTSPVAAAYDEDGKLYVVEMRDYPEPTKPWRVQLGRVRLLEDRDGDGVYETATVFADDLPWPTGICCWDGGVFVTAAPDIWYLKDDKGTGRANIRSRVFTGFVAYNVQALVNGLQWGVDNKIYGVTAGNGGEITRVDMDKPDAVTVSVRGRDFRFDPRTLKFEAISGTAQFGNAFNDWYDRFLCANRLVTGHVVIPSEYLARNPYLPASRVVQDCAAEGADVPLPMYQISPAEPWREVRTRQYHAEGVKLPLSEMVTTGIFTSGTGIAIYRGAAYPEAYRGQAFVGNVAGNLIHRRSLTPKGATFVATRIDEKCEFVASTDNWFRPVNMLNAPDGTLHVLDMYREIVEHPWSIPDNIKVHLDLNNGRDMGRIYRLTPPGFKSPPPPRLGKATSDELVKQLENPNSWWRETAQRLLIDRHDRAAIPRLRKLALESRSPLARLHALWTLEGLHALEAGEIQAALAHPTAGLREHGIRLAESQFGQSPELVAVVRKLADDASARVRFQAALSLGNSDDDNLSELLAKIARLDAADPWLQLAIVSSAKDCELRLFQMLSSGETGSALLPLLASTIGPRKKPGEAEAILRLTAERVTGEADRTAIVLALGDGFARTGRTLSTLKLDLQSPAGRLLATQFADAAKTAADESAPPARRSRAAALLVHAPFDGASRDILRKLLDPRQPQELQIAAVRALRIVASDEVPPLLLAGWRGYSPAVRRDVLSALVSRPAWSTALLDAVAAKGLAAADVDPSTRGLLLKHRDAKVAARAKDVLGGVGASPRTEVITKYQAALKLPGDKTRGLAVFKRECAACHYADGVGTSVGPAIAAMGTRTPDVLLTAILDPNREIDPRYVSYAVQTADGRLLTGIITAETPTAVTLRGSSGAVDTILRSEIESLKSLGVSLMPDGFEQKVTQPEMADLIAFLMSVK
jgi:putative membrane-bound dehydrogenase-like protein